MCFGLMQEPLQIPKRLLERVTGTRVCAPRIINHSSGGSLLYCMNCDESAGACLKQLKS